MTPAVFWTLDGPEFDTLKTSLKEINVHSRQHSLGDAWTKKHCESLSVGASAARITHSPSQRTKASTPSPSFAWVSRTPNESRSSERPASALRTIFCLTRSCSSGGKKCEASSHVCRPSSPSSCGSPREILPRSAVQSTCLLNLVLMQCPLVADRHYAHAARAGRSICVP